jgi:hypothetical protein
MSSTEFLSQRSPEWIEFFKASRASQAVSPQDSLAAVLLGSFYAKAAGVH